MKEDRFIFTVETTGSLAPDKVVLQGLNVLKTKLTDIHSHLTNEPEHDTTW